jgi:hypothetical protein
MKYSIHDQNPKYPLADRVDPVVSGFLIISQEEVVTLLNSKDARIAELKKERDEYHAMVVYMGAIMDESEGVAGYHLNGDIAKWDDLFTTSILEDAASIRDIEQQAKGVSDFVYSIEGFTEGYIQAIKEQDND